MPHNHQAMEQAKLDSRHDERIHRSDDVGTIAEDVLMMKAGLPQARMMQEELCPLRAISRRP
jgi:hypothetical protein